MTKYPLIDLSDEIDGFCHDNGLTHKQFARLASVSPSTIDKMATDNEVIRTSRIGIICNILIALGYVIDEFDPRVTRQQTEQACAIIKRMLGHGYVGNAMAAYLGLGSGSTLRVQLDMMTQGRYFKMSYDKLIALSHAHEPEFEPWCSAHAVNMSGYTVQALRIAGTGYFEDFVPERPPEELAHIRIRSEPEFDEDDYPKTPDYLLKMKHKDAVALVEKSRQAPLPDDPAARQRAMEKLLKNIGFDPFIGFAEYHETGPDGPYFTFTTETGLYRCEMTWARFRAWFRKDGQEYLSEDRDIRAWHKLSNYDMAYICE